MTHADNTGMFGGRNGYALPMDLSAAEQAHCGEVSALIREHIAAAGGWISFERYMDLALYAPGLGYYSAGAHKLGAGGDFTTAPEISALFAGCIATQCAQAMRRVDDLYSGIRPRQRQARGRPAAAIVAVAMPTAALPDA
jgi:hypothetical protein